ncbi:hypothetical protein KEM55_004825 [Ascosphaera atra]|nr:hypothetical protein KEM55_004825 [Ascosphaera atra]
MAVDAKTTAKQPSTGSSTPTSSGINTPTTRRVAKKPQTLSRRVKRYIRHNTYIVPLIPMLVILALCYRDPTPANFWYHCVYLSYPEGPKDGIPGNPTMYGKGLYDIAFVSFYTIFFSFTREFLMGKYLRRLAVACGMHGKGKVVRFNEQVYSAIYFGIFGPFGLWVMYRSDLWYFNTTAMFVGFPHRSHVAEFKAYYLLQAAYWAQQGLVLLLQLEKPRKDFKELVMHHIITLSLIVLSYRFHFTYIGLAVYITHDISDFFLATSKTFNYLDSWFIGPYFALFTFIWLYMRHILNLKILWAVLTEFRTVGPFELNWETQQYKCWISQYITFILLASLQSINLFWFYLILRIAKNYVFANVRKDERSDEEDEEGGLSDSEEEAFMVLEDVEPSAAEVTGSAGTGMRGEERSELDRGVTKRHRKNA